MRRRAEGSGEPWGQDGGGRSMTRGPRLAAVILVLSLGVLLTASAEVASAKIFKVNSRRDKVDANIGDGRCDADLNKKGRRAEGCTPTSTPTGSTNRGLRPASPQELRGRRDLRRPRPQPRQRPQLPLRQAE